MLSLGIGIVKIRLLQQMTRLDQWLHEALDGAVTRRSIWCPRVILTVWMIWWWIWRSRTRLAQVIFRMVDEALRHWVRWSWVTHDIDVIIRVDGRSLQVAASQFISIVRRKAVIHGSYARVGTSAFPWIVRSSTINVVRVFRIEGVLEMFGLFKVELFFMLEAYENELWAKKI